jgi:hypothetical protein
MDTARARLDQAMLLTRQEQDREFAEGLRRWSQEPAQRIRVGQVQAVEWTKQDRI